MIKNKDSFSKKDIHDELINQKVKNKFFIHLHNFYVSDLWGSEIDQTLVKKIDKLADIDVLEYIYFKNINTDHNYEINVAVREKILWFFSNYNLRLGESFFCHAKIFDKNNEDNLIISEMDFIETKISSSDVTKENLIQNLNLFWNKTKEFVLKNEQLLVDENFIELFNVKSIKVLDWKKAKKNYPFLDKKEILLNEINTNKILIFSGVSDFNKKQFEKHLNTNNINDLKQDFYTLAVLYPNKKVYFLASTTFSEIVINENSYWSSSICFNFSLAIALITQKQEINESYNN